jgi:hypothetical protein
VVYFKALSEPGRAGENSISVSLLSAGIRIKYLPNSSPIQCHSGKTLDFRGVLSASRARMCTACDNI